MDQLNLREQGHQLLLLILTQQSTMSKNPYKGGLAVFMTYHQGKEPPYNNCHKFTSGELEELVLQDIVKFFNFRAYGIEEPTDQDCPTDTRSNTLKYWKKLLPSFMPNCHMQWNNISNVGNPTRSTALNDVIKKIKQAVVCQQKALLLARCSATKKEFVHS